MEVIIMRSYSKIRKEKRSHSKKGLVDLLIRKGLIPKEDRNLIDLETIKVYEDHFGKCHIEYNRRFNPEERQLCNR